MMAHSFISVPRSHRWLLRVFRQLKRWVFGEGYTLRERLWEELHDRESVFFIQVGSNDGVQGDPLHKLVTLNPSWRGIFIEPVRFSFEKLKANYQNSSRFHFENVAVADQYCQKPFYYVSAQAKDVLGDSTPYWYDQLGSFEKSHILKHLDGRLEPYILVEQIRCLPLQSILEKYQVTRLDLLHIDTEGYDYRVLAQLDFRRYLPRVILFEHKHLSDQEDLAALDLLKSHGYRVYRQEGDTLALLRWWRLFIAKWGSQRDSWN